VNAKTVGPRVVVQKNVSANSSSARP
jgi:hypothetical protein